MSLAYRLACNAALLRVMLEARRSFTRDDLDALDALAADLQAEAVALDRAQARRAQDQFKHGRRAT
jgi:hypothetical protein